MARTRIAKPNLAVRSATTRSLRLLSIALVAAGAVYGQDECATTEDACLKDQGCMDCLNADAALVNCATTATTCEGWWDMACCTYGKSSDDCLGNTLLLEHLREWRPTSRDRLNPCAN